MIISRRQVLGATAGVALLSAGCSIVSRPSDSGSNTLRINYGGSADTTEIPADNAIEKKLAEVLGFAVVNERSPEDLGAALAGGQAPDLFITSRSQLRQYAAQDLLLDLTPYRDRLAAYEEFVGTANVETGLVDGKLFGVVRKPRVFSYGALWLRADWLKKLNLETPRNTDDLLRVLKAFRTEDPDGNGKNSTVGITGAGTSTFAPIFGAYGVGEPGSLYADGKAVVAGFNDPNMAGPLAYIRDLFDQQLVDPDLFGLKTAEARDRAFQGSAGAITIGWDQMTKPEFVKAQQAAQPESDWQPLDALAGPNGPGAYPTSPFGAIQGIPATVAEDAERLDRVIEFLNYICTPEGSRLVMFGIEGKHFELDGETVKPLPAMDTDGSYFFAYQMAGRDEDTYLATKFPKQSFAWEAARARDQVVQYESLVSPPEGFNTADANRFGDEQLVLFLTGERSLDTYPAFLKELNGQFDFAGYVESARQQLAQLGLPK